MRISTPNRQSRLVEAYLGHRLHPHQLVELNRQREAAGSEWEADFDRFTDPAREREAVDSIDVREVLTELGLYQRFHALQDDQVWSAEERAIYRRLAHDERAAAGTSAPANGPSAFTETARTSFDGWDRDGNLRLEPHELDLAMAGGFYGQDREAADSPSSAAVLATLRRHSALIGSAIPTDGAGVSAQDLILMEEASTPLLADIKQRVVEDFEKDLNRARELALVKPLEEEKVDPAAIRQGVAGSCVMLSTMAGLPAESLAGMLEPQGEGGAVISFADGVEEKVMEPTLSERLFHATGEAGDRWPALFEIAMAQRLYREEAPENGALRSAIDGIAPEKAIGSLTGKEADKRSLDTISVEETRRALTQLTSRDGPVICGSRPTANGDFISIEELHNGIQNGHAYTVLGFDGDNDTVTLRNPWGRGEWHFQESPDDGVFSMPVRDFYTSFRWVAGVAG